MTPETATARVDILIAEDDPDDLFLVLRAIRRVAPRLHLDVTRDGIELCERLEASPRVHPPRLVLLDLNLPRRDGREVLERLREQCLAIPIVVLTTSVERDDHDRARALGAAEVLAKPDDFRALVDLIAVVIGRYLACSKEVSS